MNEPEYCRVTDSSATHFVTAHTETIRSDASVKAVQVRDSQTAMCGTDVTALPYAKNDNPYSMRYEGENPPNCTVCEISFLVTRRIK